VNGHVTTGGVVAVLQILILPQPAVSVINKSHLAVIRIAGGEGISLAPDSIISMSHIAKDVVLISSGRMDWQFGFRQSAADSLELNGSVELFRRSERTSQTQLGE
jgi:hypothetical protein